MNAYVILDNGAGEIAREEINVPGAAPDSDAMSDAIDTAMEGWILSVGDTIRIVEAE